MITLLKLQNKFSYQIWLLWARKWVEPMFKSALH